MPRDPPGSEEEQQDLGLVLSMATPVGNEAPSGALLGKECLLRHRTERQDSLLLFSALLMTEVALGDDFG